MLWVVGLYIAVIFLANLAISTIGVVPVGFGLMAPAGVYFAGMSFTLRDVIQDRYGKVMVIAAILAGASASAIFSGTLAFASGVAFVTSEVLDFAVYTPIRKRSLVWAIVLSNTVGAIVDSAVFLYLAFGSIDFIAGNIVGKLWVTVLAVVALRIGRVISQRRREAAVGRGS